MLTLRERATEHVALKRPAWQLVSELLHALNNAQTAQQLSDDLAAEHVGVPLYVRTGSPSPVRMSEGPL